MLGGAQVADDPGVVDEDVELAERLLGERHRPLPLRFIGDVERHVAGRLAEGRRDLRAELVAHVAEHDARALGDEEARLRLALSASGARDQGHLAFQPPSHSTRSSRSRGAIYRRAGATGLRSAIRGGARGGTHSGSRIARAGTDARHCIVSIRERKDALECTWAWRCFRPSTPCARAAWRRRWRSGGSSRSG